VMAGLLTIEAMAQAGAVAVLAHADNAGNIPFFAGIDDCRFKRVVEPGDVLTLECEFVRVRGPIAKGQGRASVGGELAAEAMLTVFVASGVGLTEPPSSGGTGFAGAVAGWSARRRRVSTSR